MSDVNYTTFALIEEVVPGTTPASPAFERIRTTKVGVGANPKTTESEELGGDPNVADIPLVGIEPGGDIGTEFPYGNIDTPLEGLMRNRWANMPVRFNNGTADSVITDVTTTDVVVQASNGTKHRMGTVAAGHLVRTSGFAQAGNNGLRRAGAGTTDTTIKLAGGTAEAAPPAAARAKVVGFEGVSGDITATAGGLASTALDFTTLNLRNGQWLRIGGAAAGQRFTTVPANNDFVRIHPTTPITATALPLDNLPAGWGVDSGSGKTIQVWVSDCLSNGTDRIFYSAEKGYPDIAVPEFHYLRGVRANTWDINVPKKEKLTMSMGFVGMSLAAVTTRIASATDVAAPTGDIMNTSSHVARISENGARITGPNYVTGASIKFDNGLRRKDAVGDLGSVGFGDSKLRVKGSLETYYGSKTMYDKVLSSQATALNQIFVDPSATKAVVIDLPRVKLTSGDPQDPGVDQDRMFSPEFQALRHASLGYTARICRFEELSL
jgi:hypothetical protein